MLKSLLQYGIYIIGISILSGLLYLMFKYPPIIPNPSESPIPPIYSPYPSLELEHRMYLESKLLEYRRSA